MKYAFAVLLVLLVACSQAAVQPATPPAPTPAPVVEPTPAPQETAPSGAGAQAIVSGTDKTFGTVNTTSVLKIDDVTCDRDKRSITFRFANNDEKDWQMDQDVPFGATSMAPVRIFINNYEANRGSPYFKDGETLFGPNVKFSENCGGVTVLKPGADVTCTIYPVPLKTETALSAGANQIFVDSPTSHHIIQFTC